MPLEVALPVVQLSVAALRQNAWNPNRMNERTMQAERESIDAFGFIDPVTARKVSDEPETYEIIDGEHRWRIATEMGMEDIPVVVLDVDEATAKKLTIVLNETRGSAEIVPLAKLLTDLAQTSSIDDLLLALPYSSAQLDDLLKVGALDFDFGDDPGKELAGLQKERLASNAQFTRFLQFDKKQSERFDTFVGMIQRELNVETIEEAVIAALEKSAKAF